MKRIVLVFAVMSMMLMSCSPQGGSASLDKTTSAWSDVEKYGSIEAQGANLIPRDSYTQEEVQMNIKAELERSKQREADRQERIAEYIKIGEEKEAARLAEEEAARIAEEEAAAVYYEPVYYEPVYQELAYTEHPGANGSYSANDLYSGGVVSDNGVTYTWYSENALPGGGLTELNNNGRTVNEDGFVVDGDGYIAIASPYGQDEIGTIIDTPWGEAKVYDANSGGSYDLYTSW